MQVDQRVELAAQLLHLAVGLDVLALRQAVELLGAGHHLPGLLQALLGLIELVGGDLHPTLGAGVALEHGGDLLGEVGLAGGHALEDLVGVVGALDNRERPLEHRDAAFELADDHVAVLELGAHRAEHAIDVDRAGGEPARGAADRAVERRGARRRERVHVQLAGATQTARAGARLGRVLVVLFVGVGHWRSPHRDSAKGQIA
ncbi:hypothetical protein D3C72_1080870 [compost metagenome]